jgi:hypothetical protein
LTSSAGPIPARSLLVVPGDDGPTGLVLRRPEATGAKANGTRSTMCRVCLAEHGASGGGAVRRALAGAAGRRGNTVGEYLCADLGCPLYVRGKRQPKMRLVRREETLTLDERVNRTMTNLSSFVGRVLAG